MATTSRMLTLLSLLQVRRDWPGAALAQRLDISERTVRRDVERLRELGYRIHAIKGPDGGYRLESGSELPPLLFDDDQAVVLALALQSARSLGPGLEEPASRALATVRQVMPSRLRHRIDAVEVVTLDRVVEPVAPEVLARLGAAIRDRTVVRFDYRDEPRRAEPYGLVAHDGRWYLAVWDLEKADWRTFRVDRMTLKTHVGARFAPREIPTGAVASFVSATFKGSSTDAWPCRGSAVLAVPARDVAPYVGDVEDLGDSCRVTLGSWSWMGLAASFARFDADLTEVEPAELREAMRELSARFARATTA